MNKLPALVWALLLTGSLSACSSFETCKVSECADDAQITANVQMLLKQHADLGPPNLIYVKTLNHVVYLTGQVNTDLAREAAESLAREVSGVNAVINSLALSYPG